MKTSIETVTEKSVKKAGEILKSGGIVAFPTDTVYGLGAVYTDETAIRKLFAVKGRDEDKPLSVLVSDPAQVEELAVDLPERARVLGTQVWPGPLTVDFEKAKSGFLSDFRRNRNDRHPHAGFPGSFGSD